eukprot:CAMPEP_0170557518 /NCGR_PEP_ID=MMETSP0211-20121228/27062_1 /TAXON_ID=311385 /ORGANISM="Pseudokeronopsis sp., Strain OXSARD2" /LENGTH=44 /DNA_ID= /DNA_START= /DNA_END= /DNA_ORIENTATION=
MALNPAFEKVIYNRKDNNVETFVIVPDFDGYENYTDRAEIKAQD